MGWTVIKTTENGTEEKLQEEFEVKNWDNLDLTKFKVIKNLDPYGDTTFNVRQLDDLKNDLKTINKLGLTNKKTLEDLIRLIDDCQSESTSYLKFYGD